MKAGKLFSFEKRRILADHLSATEKRCDYPGCHVLATKNWDDLPHSRSYSCGNHDSDRPEAKQ